MNEDICGSFLNSLGILEKYLIPKTWKIKRINFPSFWDYDSTFRDFEKFEELWKTLKNPNYKLEQNLEFLETLETSDDK